jgi:hypothetical protein
MNRGRELCFYLPAFSCLFLLTAELSAYFQLFSIKNSFKKWFAKVKILFPYLQTGSIFFSITKTRPFTTGLKCQSSGLAACFETMSILTLL